LAQLRKRGLEFTADIVGEDTLDGEIQGLSHTLGIGPCVSFHGFATNREVRTIVEGAHLHVVSSRHEAGPVALLEAALAGVPTVGTSVGHVQEWAPDAAVTVPVGDSEALADAAEELLGNESRRRTIARAAQARALYEDADRTAGHIMEIYREMAATAPQRP